MLGMRLAVLIGTSLGLALSPCLAQAPYYKGKRVTVLINFDAGSAPDVEGRVFARHFAKHIDGEPQLIVQNLSGAGGVNGTQYLGERAPKDGTTFGYLTGSAWNFASQPQLFRVDYRNYEFIGFQGGTVVYYVRTDVPPGIKRPADILKANGLVSGGIAATTGRDLAIRLTLDILDVPFRHVTGYRSGEQVQLAIQRGEVHFSAATTPGYRGTIEPSMVKQGSVIPLFVDPMWDGRTFSNSRQIEDLPIEPYQEFYKRVKGGALPSGIKWDTYLALTMLNGTMQRLFALPPGAPAAAVAALRTALGRLEHDKAFAADIVKTVGYVPEYEAGSDINERVRSALGVRSEIREFVADYIKALK